MPQALSESRFYMWRAVFALAHLDGRITQEERDFAGNYLANVPFSDAQKQTLLDDLEEPRSVNEMLIGISEPADMSDFFQFAQMMAWADGELDEREQALIERLTAEQMNRFNKAELSFQIRQARQAAAVRRAVEDEEFKRQARELLGVGNIFRAVVPWMDPKRVFDSPEEQSFELWRAVFALVHADRKVTDEEREYVYGMMDVFRFTPEQRAVIEDDLVVPKDLDLLFKRLETEEQRRRFFLAARTILWVDGEFSDEERKAIERLRQKIGPSIENFRKEIAWLDERPPAPEAGGGAGDGKTRVAGIFHQMSAFYYGDRDAA